MKLQGQSALADYNVQPEGYLWLFLTVSFPIFFDWILRLNFDILSIQDFIWMCQKKQKTRKQDDIERLKTVSLMKYTVSSGTPQ